MRTILTATHGGIALHNPDGEARVGSWCKPPQVPDLCYTCIDLETLSHRPATGYIEQDGWRYGTCEGCNGRVDVDD